MLLLPPVPRPCFLIPLSRIQHLISSIQFQTHRSATKMASPPKWEVEKKKLLLLSTDERRKMYKLKDYVTLDQVAPWRTHISTIKDNTINNSEDLDFVKEIQINHDLNKRLSEKVSIYKGDITKLEVDAIVNAANSHLKAGGGVDGAIHRAAGPYLQLECNSLGGCNTGDAKISGGYDLPARYVIHTVGPQDQYAPKLKSCYETCFSIIQKHNIKSIAFPCISTGIYGFPNRLAGHIALQSTRKFLEENLEMERVIFCTFMPIDVEIYETLMQLYFPY